MRNTWCPFCKKHRGVVSYQKDDPVLTCGHVITYESTKSRNELAEGVYSALRDIVYEIMQEDKVSFEQAERMFWDRY